MLEFFKHALGTGGEHCDPNLFNISMLAASISSAVYYVKIKFYNIYKK